MAGTLQPFKERMVDELSNKEVQYDVQNVEVNIDETDQLFSVPAPPAPAFDIDDNAKSVTVPFVLDTNCILFNAEINGHSVIATIDTGADLAMDQDMAKQVHVRTKGEVGVEGFGPDTAKAGLGLVKELDIGGLKIHDTEFMVVHNNTSIHGVVILGRPVLVGLVLQIDFDHSLITFTRADSFTYLGKALPISFVFRAVAPEVDGTLDGVDGKFTIDTGSEGWVQTAKPFVETNHLNDKYKPAFEMVGYGVGGSTLDGIARVQTLTLGQASVHNVVVQLSTDTGGYGADATKSANIGQGRGLTNLPTYIAGRK